MGVVGIGVIVGEGVEGVGEGVGGRGEDVWGRGEGVGVRDGAGVRGGSSAGIIWLLDFCKELVFAGRGGAGEDSVGVGGEVDGEVEGEKVVWRAKGFGGRGGCWVRRTGL